MLLLIITEHFIRWSSLIFFSPSNVWYWRLKLLFTMTVKIDGPQEPVDIKCAYVSFCYGIKLENPVWSNMQ